MSGNDVLERAPGARAAAKPETAPPGTEEQVFAAILERISGLHMTYVGLGRLTSSAPDYQDPERFCRDLMERELTGLGAAGRADFLAWAGPRAPRNGLLAILAALDHLGRGERPAARRHLERALSLNQNDLFAQRLWRLAQVEPPPEPELAGRFCASPFDSLETQERGRVYFCCPAWLPAPIGNLDHQSPAEIWNSAAAKDIRRSILDGSYRYCSRMHCPKLFSLPKSTALTDGEHREIVAEGRTTLARGPRRLSLNHDRSCNLSCPSCRSTLLVARKAEQARMNAMAERALLPLIRDARKLHVTGSGDAFGSAHFRHVLRRVVELRLPGLKLDLQTNGLLLEQSWHEIGLDGLVDRLCVSIDAARAATYAVVRRGGDFRRLIHNLAFAADKRRAGLIRRVRLDFLVQRANFREMPEAVELCRAFGFDGIKFQMIRSWGSYTPEEFADHHVGAPDHPQFEALRDVLSDPRLAQEGVELWGFHGVEPRRPATLPKQASDSPNTDWRGAIVAMLLERPSPPKELRIPP